MPFCMALKMFLHTRIDMPSDLQPNHSIGLKLQRSKKWLVRGLVKFATAVARLVGPDLLG